MKDAGLLSILLVVVAGFMTGGLRMYAVRREILDHPNQRSSHTVATPRGGGVSIVIVVFMMAVFLYLFEILSTDYLLAILVAGGLVAGAGYWDDHKHIPAQWRILIQSLAAILAILWIGGFKSLQIGDLHFDFGWLAYPITALFLVWLLNLYNFMDGIDGIAGSEAVAVCGSAMIIEAFIYAGETGEFLWLRLLQLSLISGCLGFLLWNWPPAKIFMGDVGSGFIGFTIGLFILASVNNEILPLWSWCILLGVFFVDSTITLLRRIFRRDRWYEAHRSHAYQNAARRWHSHLKVTVGVIAINLFWLLPMAWLAALLPETAWAITVLAMFPLFVVAVWLKAGSACNS